MEKQLEVSELSNSIRHLSSDKVKSALLVNTVVRGKMSSVLRSLKFIEVPPVIYSQITDPLNHPVDDPRFTYVGVEYSLTKSMIFHKQLLVKNFPRIFTFSPNVRLETAEKAKTGRHLTEFTQLDLEVRDATREDVMKIAESLIRESVLEVKLFYPEILEKRKNVIDIPSAHFRKYRYSDLRDKYGKDFEMETSSREKQPFWIVDIPLTEREFYDREDENEPGILKDMDLIYPEGYGEGISGGEREYLPERILERIKAKGQAPSQFRIFTEASSMGLVPSAGFGIGIERFIRYICGYERIEDVHPFPKIPGESSL